VEWYPACKFGHGCFQKNFKHLQCYLHPGDRNYRKGMVRFPKVKGTQMEPEFPTLRVLFNFCDPDASGFLTPEEWPEAWKQLCLLPAQNWESGDRTSATADGAWRDATGVEGADHLTFAKFAAWASAAKVRLPVGIDMGSKAPKPCRFQYAGGERCPCVDFQPSEFNPRICACGHKCSVHLSDAAYMTGDEQAVLAGLSRNTTGGSEGAISDEVALAPGMDPVTDAQTLQDLQALVSATHKPSDNWTRDRGCALHGRDNCPTSSCVWHNKAPVPIRYELMRAERNWNPALWHTYTMTRAAIQEEVQHESGRFEAATPLSNLSVTGTEALNPGVNEWRLFHDLEDQGQGRGHAALRVRRIPCGECDQGRRVR
jgi:hypothetical protein